VWWNKLFGDQIKPLQPVIIIYSNQPEEFGSVFFIAGVDYVDGEQVAFWNSYHSSGRQMMEHFMKYVNWNIVGDACEGTER
jgi:superoxide dismutase